MFAIVEIAGRQFKIEKDQTLFVDRLQQEAGAELQFDRVLLTAEGDQVNVGRPTVQGVSVSATVLDHVRSRKVIVFKKKRRKGYQKQNTHRQQYTQIRINSIG